MLLGNAVPSLDSALLINGGFQTHATSLLVDMCRQAHSKPRLVAMDDSDGEGFRDS